MNVAIFWDTAQCSLYVSRRFRRKYELHLWGRKSVEQEINVQQTASRFSTLKTEVKHSSETSIQTALYPRRWKRS
jgi:hypothetical protein